MVKNKNIIVVFLFATSYNDTTLFCKNCKDNKMPSSQQVKALNLEDLRLFVAIVQAGSLSRASQLTGVAVSRLSRRLTALEGTLGTKLVNRGKKGVHLNELGEGFLTHAQAILEHSYFALTNIQNKLGSPQGKLRLSLPTDMANLIIDKLPSYLAKHPQVRLELMLSQDKIQMIQDGIDIAIRAGAINNENVVAKPLFLIESCVYASPSYLAKNGTPTHPADLTKHKLIAQSLTVPWQFITKTAQEDRQTLMINPLPLVACNDFLAVKELLSAHLGIGVLPKSLALDTNLVPLLTDWQLPAAPLSVIYYKNRGAIATIKSFVDWLMTQDWAMK